MSTENTIELAESIADLVIDKSYWGNEWFFLFSMLLVGLVCALICWGGSFLTTRAQNSAMRRDFKKALADLEVQTDSLKNIEERIAHEFLEKRELTRIKREKIEEAYTSTVKELELLGNNFSVAVNDAMRDVTFPSHEVDMLLALYFKDSLEKELKYYREQRGALLTRIRELTEENYSRDAIVGKKRVSDNQHYFSNYAQSITNIHIALEIEMKNLTSSKTSASGADAA